uniref:Uncharacterized protein n=1 Tax=Rhizophora mucronata TaxID=61149 RepID=A0A2P2PQ65_RHIMU
MKTQRCEALKGAEPMWHPF